ncbi:MAG TPA: CBS domain-containing protein [Jatrophihabitans sp.]|nr:CBS domain-containing protein [Jatrophihabitans sp.]
MVTAELNTTVAELVALLAEHKIGAVPVTDGSRTVGIVSERDVVRQLNTAGADVLGSTVEQLMSVDLLTCTPQDSLDDIARLMTDHRIRHLPVLADGELAGIVTIGDVVAARLRELERTREQLESYITQG